MDYIHRRHRLAQYTKQDPYKCCLPEIHLISKKTYKLKVTGWEKRFFENRNQKKAGEATCISNKREFKTKRQRKTLCNDQEINPRRYNDCKYIYAPNIGTPRYVRQMLITMKGEISSNIVIVGNFNIHFCQWINHSERKLTRRHVP